MGREDFWRREWLLIPVFLPGESHGQRSLAGYNTWGHMDRTQWLNHHGVPCPVSPCWSVPVLPHTQGFCLSVQFSRSVVSDSLRPHGLHHTRPPCPSPTPGVYPNSCPLSRWCHPSILCPPLLLPPSIIPSIRVFSNESTLGIKWPKYWSFGFSISPSNEYSGLISFKMDWLDLFAVQRTLKSLLQLQKHQFFGAHLSL